MSIRLFMGIQLNCVRNVSGHIIRVIVRGFIVQITIIATAIVVVVVVAAAFGIIITVCSIASRIGLN